MTTIAVIVCCAFFTMAGVIGSAVVTKQTIVKESKAVQKVVQEVKKVEKKQKKSIFHFLRN